MFGGQKKVSGAPYYSLPIPLSKDHSLHIGFAFSWLA